MQVQEGKDFPNILYGSNQEKDKRSITLKPGHEYAIELEPYGQTSSDDFKAMSFEKRKCKLAIETNMKSTHPTYTYDNCKFDCYVKLAYKTCRCVGWDFVNKIDGAKECDLFGRTCFSNMIESLTHSSDQHCKHCVDECDYVKYRRRIINEIPLNQEKVEEISKYYPYEMVIYYLNKYTKIRAAFR